MEEQNFYQSNCRIFDRLAEARPGDRIFICTRAITLKYRVCPAGWPFLESAMINLEDIKHLLASGELAQVGTLNAGRIAEYDRKYSFLAEPPKPQKTEAAE